MQAGLFSKCAFGIVPILAALTLVGCGDSDGSISGGRDGSGTSGGTGAPAIAPLPTCDGSDTGVVDACGGTITAGLDIHDPVVINLTGLTPNSQHEIVITDPTSAEITPAGGYLATTDEVGALYRATVVQNMPDTASLGDYLISVTEQGSATPAQTLSYTLVDRSRVRCVDGANSPQASFLASENVFARVEAGGGTLADGDYDLYVVSDLELPFPDGGPIGGTPVTVTVTGGVGTVDLGAFAPGAYDVVVDVDADATFDQDIDLISRQNRLLACFAIQSASGGTVTPDQIAVDRNGNKRDLFDPDANIPDIRDLFASVTPLQRSQQQQPAAVDLYVVAHQDVWSGSDPLNDVSAAAETSAVQADTNSQAPWLLWERPSLQAGCYDVVIDTNQNGVFNPGIDFVDNIDHLGAVSCGVRVSQPGCTNVTINSHADGDIVTDTAITLAGNVVGGPVQSFVTVTNGLQSNTISLTVAGGAYSLDLPLFNGTNQITVWVVYADGSSCAETIEINSQAERALFRAQLTWDGSTDMDLHLVRPGGAYSNGGGGAGDCNYANCNVGLDGSQPNSIDWGLAGEADDPKLDVDCIACGNGIENIWMNQISEDGDYIVYVDAFTGSETNVTVTMFIRGVAVGQVNCGSMSSGGNTDSCRVGTVRWTGGSGGTGSFIADGTKADNF